MTQRTYGFEPSRQKPGLFGSRSEFVLPSEEQQTRARGLPQLNLWEQQARRAREEGATKANRVTPTESEAIAPNKASIFNNNGLVRPLKVNQNNRDLAQKILGSQPARRERIEGTTGANRFAPNTNEGGPEANGVTQKAIGFKLSSEDFLINAPNTIGVKLSSKDMFLDDNESEGTTPNTENNYFRPPTDYRYFNTEGYTCNEGVCRSNADNALAETNSSQPPPPASLPPTPYKPTPSPPPPPPTPYLTPTSPPPTLESDQADQLSISPQGVIQEYFTTVPAPADKYYTLFQILARSLGDPNTTELTFTQLLNIFNTTPHTAIATVPDENRRLALHQVHNGTTYVRDSTKLIKRHVTTRDVYVLANIVGINIMMFTQTPNSLDYSCIMFSGTDTIGYNNTIFIYKDANGKYHQLIPTDEIRTKELKFRSDAFANFELYSLRNAPPLGETIHDHITSGSAPNTTARSVRFEELSPTSSGRKQSDEEAGIIEQHTKISNEIDPGGLFTTPIESIYQMQYTYPEGLTSVSDYTRVTSFVQVFTAMRTLFRAIVELNTIQRVNLGMAPEAMFYRTEDGVLTLADMRLVSYVPDFSTLSVHSENTSNIQTWPIELQTTSNASTNNLITLWHEQTAASTLPPEFQEEIRKIEENLKSPSTKTLNFPLAANVYETGATILMILAWSINSNMADPRSNIPFYTGVVRLIGDMLHADPETRISAKDALVRYTTLAELGRPGVPNGGTYQQPNRQQLLLKAPAAKMDARGTRRSPLSNDDRARATLQALRGIQTNPQPRRLRLKAPVEGDDETSEPVEAGQQSDMMNTTDTGHQSATEDEDTSGAPPMSAQIDPGSDPSMGSAKDSTPVSVPSLDSPLIPTQIDPVVRPRQYWDRIRRARAATRRPPSPDSSPGNVQRNQQFANVFTTMEDRANNTLEGSPLRENINQDTENQSAEEDGDEDTSDSPSMSAQIDPGSDQFMGSARDSTPISSRSFDSPLMSTQIDPVVRPRQYWNRIRRARAATIRPPSPDSSPGNVQRNQQFANVFTTMEDRANNTLEGSPLRENINKDPNNNFSLAMDGSKIATIWSAPPEQEALQPTPSAARPVDDPRQKSFIKPTEEMIGEARKRNPSNIRFESEQEAPQPTPPAAPPVGGLRKRQPSFRIKNKEQIVEG